jgi:hypothetical protein
MGSRRRADPLVVEGLANGWTDARVAEHAGVSVGTVRKRRADREFMAQVRELVKERERERNRRLVDFWNVGEQVTGPALRTLVDLLNSPSAIARLGAARTILDRFAPTERPEDVELPGVVKPPEHFRDLFEWPDEDPEVVELERRARDGEHLNEGELHRLRLAQEAKDDQLEPFVDVLRARLRARRDGRPPEPPQLRVVEEPRRVEEPPAAGRSRAPNDGLTDLERAELVKRGLYRQGVPASIQRETLKRAGLG